MTERSTDGAEHRLVRSSAVVGLGTALSRVTGLLRVSALAALGLGRLTDVYNIANSTPNIVYELLLGGILTATLVPLYVEHYENNDQRATDAINSVAIATLAVISVLGFIAAPWIIDLYTLRLHGAGKVAQQALATDLLRWFMPQVFFYGLTALATAMLNARRRFAAAAFAPVLNNVVVISVLLALPRVASEPPTVTSVLQDPALVVLLGLGTTAGIVAMALVLLPALRHAGRQALLGLGVAPPGGPSPRSSVGLDRRVRGDEPGGVLGRTLPRVRHEGRRVGVPRGVHVLPAAARPVRGVDHDGTRARAREPRVARRLRRTAARSSRWGSA